MSLKLMHLTRLCVLLLFMAVYLLLAQDVRAQEGDCAPILAAISRGIRASTCATVATGSACYASDDVVAELRSAGLVFDAPNDRVNVADLRSIDTQNPYGAVIMYVETASDPVKIIVFGDSAVEPQNESVFTMHKVNGKMVCEKTPAGMLIQTQAGQSGQVVVNGVTIRLASTALVSMEDAALYDQDPKLSPARGSAAENAQLCGGFTSECSYANCAPNRYLVQGPNCSEQAYDYIEPGLYRVVIYGSGRVSAGATDRGAEGEMFAFGSRNTLLPAEYTFCWPGAQEGSTGFEVVVRSLDRSAQVDRITLQYVSADCAQEGAPPGSSLTLRDQLAISELMREWDRVHWEAIAAIRETDLPQVLTDTALAEQRETIRLLKDRGCTWSVREIEPAKALSMDAAGSDHAKVYMLKHWDMDLTCRGRVNSSPENDGTFVAVYTIERTVGGWRIAEKATYDVSVDSQLPTAGSGRNETMTVTNVEGEVEVSVLGVTRILAPGQQVRIVLSGERPVDVGSVILATAVPSSPLVRWLSVEPQGLPFVNKDRQVTKSVLPAPLYYIDSETKQIHRLEVDGKTSHQITAEPAGIDAFDVSPTDDSLVFVTNNQLIQTDRMGGNRQAKVVGPNLEDMPLDFWYRTIHSPAFSPDGSMIAFTLDGINLIPSGPSTSYDRILVNQPFDEPELGLSIGYHSVIWSPDGTKLLVSFVPYEGQFYSLYDLRTGAEQELNRSDYWVTSSGDAAWTSSGNKILIANHSAASYGSPGLSIGDTRSGQLIGLIVSSQNATDVTVAAMPFSLDGSDILFFSAQSVNFDGNDVFRLSRLNTKTDSMSVVQERGFRLGPALWDTHGRGIVVVDSDSNDVYWMPVAGPILSLPIRSSQFRWGSKTNADHGLSTSGVLEPAATPSDRDMVTSIVNLWDEIHRQAIQEQSSDRLPEVLAGTALEQQRRTISSLRERNCFWSVDIVEPASLESFTFTADDEAVVTVTKNWNMDSICGSERSESPENDGAFRATYTLRRMSQGWRIVDKAIEDYAP